MTEGGALLANDEQWLRVAAPSPPAAPGDRIVRGPGWTLTLNPGWSLRPVAGRPGSYDVVPATGK